MRIAKATPSSQCPSSRSFRPSSFRPSYRYSFREEKAQSAMYDAMIFFVLLLIASGIMFFGVSHLWDQKEVVNRSYRLAYTRQVQDSVLLSIVNDTYYYDENGINRSYPQRSVLELIEMYLFLNEQERVRNIDMDLSPLDNSIRLQYKIAIDPPFKYGVKAMFLDTRTGKYSFTWNNASFPITAYASSRDGLVNNSRVEITLYIWE